MARHLVTFLFLVFAIHVISAEEEVSTNALNEYVSVPRLMQTARQFGDLLDDDTGIIMGVLLFAALGIPLLGLLALGAVLLASSFVYRYAFTGAGLNTNTLANFGTGLNTGITTGTITVTGIVPYNLPGNSTVTFRSLTLFMHPSTNLVMTPSSPTSSQVDIEARFSHLLNPIRDLAKNWNIDLSSNLEEYLADLGNIELTFDNGKTTMNFAQAALLIQGSACVYSKKVEYLYNLVCGILKLFSSGKHLQNNAEKVNNNDFSDAVADAIDEFLSLDDIEVDNNLNKKEDDNRMKKLPFKFLSRTPTVLTPSELAVKGDIMLYNRVGDVIGNKNDFQVNVSRIHSSGLLVIDTTIAAESIDMRCSAFDTKPLISNNPIEKTNDDSDSCDNVGDQNEPYDDICHSPALPDSCDNQEVNCSTPVQEEMVEPSLRRSLRIKKSKSVEEVTPVKPKEPLVLLDPYEETKDLIKPMKKLRRCLIPESLEVENGKPKRKKSKLEKQFESVSEFCSQQFEKKGKAKCKSFKEFENQFWKEMDRRKEISAKKLIRKLAKEEKLKQLSESHDSENDDVDDNCGNDVFHDDDDDCGVELDNVFDNVPDNLPSESIFNSNKADQLNDAEENVGGIIQSYEDLVREHVDKYMSSAVNYAQFSDLGKRVKEWEEKIKPRLEDEDKHESYDIHVYGSRVLETFSSPSTKQSLSFKTICEKKKKYEVCRYFLASLQLANNYNIEISSAGPLDVGVDSMSLTILSKERHHEELQDYRAPSFI
ncbi:Condensin-2 complex subunit H2 [Nymphon striatum]|nr:Condensin-2 complex subunit H2 [Nymphon striatum]